MNKPTQKQIFYIEQQKIGEANEVYLFVVLPTIKNMEEFEKLVGKRPHVYEKYRGVTEAYLKQNTQN
jgi:hypothetical protein